MYQFTINITVDRVPYQAGDLVAGEVLGGGELETMLRLGQIVKLPDESADAGTPDDASEGKKSRKK